MTTDAFVIFALGVFVGATVVRAVGVVTEIRDILAAGRKEPTR